MGHSSIQVTVDTYGHLIPGADVAWIDRLDESTTPQPNATPAQPEEETTSEESAQVIEKIGEPGRTRTCNPLIKSSKGIENQRLTRSAINCYQMLQVLRILAVSSALHTLDSTR